MDVSGFTRWTTRCTTCCSHSSRSERIGQWGKAHAVAVTCSDDRARVFVTARRLSQVQYELALRLGVRPR